MKINSSKRPFTQSQKNIFIVELSIQHKFKFPLISWTTKDPLVCWALHERLLPKRCPGPRVDLPDHHIVSPAAEGVRVCVKRWWTLLGPAVTNTGQMTALVFTQCRATAYDPNTGCCPYWRLGYVGDDGRRADVLAETYHCDAWQLVNSRRDVCLPDRSWKSGRWIRSTDAYGRRSSRSRT